ncbi:MAG: hypothetical protein KDE28_28185 [Anaerolineales bacterium]|nr:hypothetical protein [Anaerolineales bacterium]
MLPRHIAFIMDGNSRRATAQGLPRSAGHKAGFDYWPAISRTDIEAVLAHYARAMAPA